MIADYMIVTGNTPEHLSRGVVNALGSGKGWEIYGQPFVAEIVMGEILFCQPMTKSGAYEAELVEMIG